VSKKINAVATAVLNWVLLVAPDVPWMLYGCDSLADANGYHPTVGLNSTASGWLAILPASDVPWMLCGSTADANGYHPITNE